MKFVRKSIIRKLFLNLFLFALVLSALAFYFYKSEQDQLPMKYFLVALAVFLIYFLISYWVDVVRPLRKIMGPVQALLTGKPYKRIYTTRIDEIGVLAQFFNKVTTGIGEVSTSMKDRERMMDELEIASQLQGDILPDVIPSVDGLQIVAKNRPATELGGDSFNVFKSNDKTYIYLGDVTGHGVAAGLMMTMASSLMTVFGDISATPYEIVVNVNKYIKRHVKRSMFMTMVLLCWYEASRKMTYVGAGHEYILVYRADSGECEKILSGGVALGMMPDNSTVVKEQEIYLDTGDFLVLYSDGITEARNEKGEFFGLERLMALIKEYAPQYSADGVHFHIAKDVSEYMVGHPQEDDITLIVVKRDEGIKASDQKNVGETTF